MKSEAIEFVKQFSKISVEITLYKLLLNVKERSEVNDKSLGNKNYRPKTNNFSLHLNQSYSSVAPRIYYL